MAHAAKQQVVRQTNSVMVFTYFHIGRLIVEQEQGGKATAAYGKETIKLLSEKLTTEFGKGFSTSNLAQMRLFFLAFESHLPIFETVSGKSGTNPAEIKSQTVSVELAPLSIFQTLSGKSFADIFPLSWSHYIILSKIESPDERSFYEIESRSGNWSARELQRQFDSGLFERLSLSKNKKKVKEPDENPTVGIIICKHKSDAMVEITLAENQNQIFASRYKLYLPTKDELK